MRALVVCGLVAVSFALGGGLAIADQVSDILSQATLPEYQSYLRVLTGLDPLPGSPPVYLTNRYGSNASKAEGWMKNQFTSWGYSVTDPNYAAGSAPNVIAQRVGATRPQDIYVISAHFDGVAAGAGCDDNGSGTAAVMMAARILAQQQFQATVRFVGFSREEDGLVGSAAYAQQCAVAHENILGVINLDMILHPGFDNHAAGADYDLDLCSDAASLTLTQFVAQKFNQYTTIPVQVHSDGGYGSDQYSFWQFGFHAFEVSENTANEIWGGSNATYHTSGDVMTHPDFDWPFALEATRGSMAGLIGLAGLVPEPASALGLLLVAACVRGRRPRS